MDAPEYKTLTNCSSRLASCIQQSPNDIVLQLRPSGILAPGDLSYFDNPHHNNDQKAQKIVEVVLNQVKINSRVFPAFVFALEAAGPWTGTVVSELKDLYRVPSQCLESPCPNRVDKSTSTTLSLEHRGCSSQDQATQTADSSPVRSLNQIVEAKPTVDIESSMTDRILDRETTRMRREFAGLVHKVIASIKLARVEVKSLATFFQQIEHVNAVLVSARSSRLFFTPQVIHEFESGDVDDIFRILKDYYSWFNFDLIEDIIKGLCSNDVVLKRELCDYKDRMKQYCKNRVFEVSDLPNAFGEHRHDAKPCVFKIDEEWETMRFSELETIKTIICDVLRLRGVALFLRTVSNGCVELTFDIPEHVANVVFPLSKDQVGALKAHGIQYHDSSKSLPLDPEPLIEGGVNDEQLDTTIRMRDTDALGQCFDSMSALLTKLSLSPAEATIVNRTAGKQGNQAGIAHALRLWRNANPSKATYRTLLEIAESLRRDTTSQICGVLARELPMEERFPHYSKALAHGSEKLVFPNVLKWTRGVPAIRKMSCPISAVSDGKTAYFRNYRSRNIFSFELVTKRWKNLPECRVKDTTLVLLPVALGAAFVLILHTVGGIKRREDRQDEKDLYTDALYQLAQDETRWVPSTYPGMLSKRSQVTAVCSNNILVAAGGRDDMGSTATVEILRTTHRVWHRVTDLPSKQYMASGCVCDGKLYILGGCDMMDGAPKPIKSAFEVNLSSLEHACTESSSSIGIEYTRIMNLPLNNASFVSVPGYILSIGGSAVRSSYWVSSNEVHAYHPPSGTWQHLSDSSLLEKRCFCFSVVFDRGDKLNVMVVGGYTTRADVDCTNSVEIAEIPVSQ